MAFGHFYPSLNIGSIAICSMDINVNHNTQSSSRPKIGLYK